MRGKGTVRAVVADLVDATRVLALGGPRPQGVWWDRLRSTRTARIVLVMYWVMIHVAMGATAYSVRLQRKEIIRAGVSLH